MSIIDHDVTFGARQSGVSFDRIHYADDTVLLAADTCAANRILWAVESISMQFGLRLKRGKCSHCNEWEQCC